MKGSNSGACIVRVETRWGWEIVQDDDRVYAVRLTSKSHEGDRDFLAIGSGPWDTRGRPSWIDIEQVFSVHWRGMRREASTLDRDRFARVADALQRRYGWSVAD